MKRTLAALLVAAISISLPSSPASADDYYDGWSAERSWHDGYDRGRDDGYYRDRGRGDYRDEEDRSDYSENRHKKRDTAIIAGIAGLALGAVIVGSLAKHRQSAPVYSRPAPRDRLIYDPN
jgi:hypothetical protein